MPGQMRGNQRGRGVSRGGGGGRGRGRGRGGARGRGRSSSRGGGGGGNVGNVGRGDGLYRGQGRHTEELRGGAGLGSSAGDRGLVKEVDVKQNKVAQEPVVMEKSFTRNNDAVKEVSKKGKKKGKNKTSFEKSSEKSEGSKDKNVKLNVLKKSRSEAFCDAFVSEDQILTKGGKKLKTSNCLTVPFQNLDELKTESFVCPVPKVKEAISFSLMNVSNSTGLKVLSISSSITGYVFTATDRARIVRSIPGVVIINTAGKGDALTLGVDMDDDEKLAKLLHQLKDQSSWNVSCLNTCDADPFSYFAGWKLLPRVDKSGMFQLIVDLKTHGRRSKDSETSLRNQLLDLIKEFNIAKVVHGEGETILLVGHVLECVAYSDLIRKKFTLEKRHTWQPRPTGQIHPPAYHPGHERYFWVKVKCPDLSNLTTAHKQFSVFHQLSSAGKVLQLEHQLFGVEDNYMVVYSDMGDAKLPVLGQQFCLLELLPDALPDMYTPSYGVDAWGFYSVSGKFPNNLGDETRNKFAEDMKKVGAVGFKSGESDESFSLHFVNSRCLEEISHCSQNTTFRLTILSSLVRKASSDKKIKKMIPTILKYKELKLKEKVEVKQVVGENSSAYGVQKSEDDMSSQDDVKGIENPGHGVKKIKSPVEKGKSVEELKMNKKIKEVKSTKENCKVTKEKKFLENKPLSKSASDDVNEDSVNVSESELLRFGWEKGAILHSQVTSVVKILKSIPEVGVSERLGLIEFTVPKLKVADAMKIPADCPYVHMHVNRFFKDKFGLVLEKNATIAQLKEDFSKFGVEIEVRSQVYVLWFGSKLDFYKALINPLTSGYNLVPCMQNFKYSEAAPIVENIQENSIDIKMEVSSLVQTSSKKPLVKDSIENVEVKKVVSNPTPATMFVLTEREIFGFIWQKTKAKNNIRDDQVISRQLTNFIKTVSCIGMSVDEDGLVVSFPSQAELSTALTQFCPPTAPVPDTQQLSALARKFTILPFRGFYGLFSVKRVKPEHFTRFGDYKIRNCGVWFADKLSVFNVLRDPFISKTYPGLFLDCRNVYILSSKNNLPKVEPDIEHGLDAPSGLLDRPSVGVLTRSAMARIVASIPTNVETDDDQKKNSEEPSTMPGELAPTLPTINVSNGEMLLKGLLPTELLLKTELGLGKFGYKLGKIGHVVGEKVSTEDMVDKIRNEVEVGGCLGDKESYSSKDVKEVEDVINSLVERKLNDGPGETLREVKLKRVEHFLKDQLGVECRLSKEGKEKLKAGGMIIEDESKVDVEFICKKGQDLEEKSAMEKFETGVLQCKEDVDQVKEDNESKEERRKRLLKLEADRRCFEKEALIFPEVVANEVKRVEGVVLKTNTSMTINSIENADKSDADAYKSPPVGGSSIESYVPTRNLTPDLAGFFTLSIPITGSEPSVSSVQEDISWFDTPVSILPVDIGDTAFIEVKFKDESIAMAVLQGLQHKYPGFVGDDEGKFKHLVKDTQTGLYTLCFTDSKRKRFKATMEKFSTYDKELPVISRGLGNEQVLVGFHGKEGAVLALRENIECEDFPGLHVAPVSRI